MIKCCDSDAKDFEYLLCARHFASWYNYNQKQIQELIFYELTFHLSTS